MAMTGTCYFDRKGRAHLNPTKATVADIMDVLACDQRVALSLLCRRDALEEVFAQYDVLMAAEAQLRLKAKPPLGIIAGGRA